jgi:hypothetical protein
MDLEKHLIAIHQHLKKTHEDRADYHNHMANAHTSALGQHEEKSAEHAFHKNAAESHMVARDACQDRMEECDKARSECEKAGIAGMVRKMFDNLIVPTNVSAVAPPRSAPAGLTMVIRPGQPEAKAPVPNVAPEFQKLFSMDDGEPEHSIL